MGRVRLYRDCLCSASYRCAGRAAIQLEIQLCAALSVNNRAQG